MTMRTLFSVGMLVTVGMLAGRVLGLLREALVAAHFGVGLDADMAIGLLIIPDFVTALLVGSAASATLVPAFATRTAQEASFLFFQALVASIVLASVAGVLIFWQMSNMQPAMTFALGMALAALPMSAANAVLVAWLQHKNCLRVPAFSNAIFNAVIVLGLWILVSGINELGVVIFFATATRLTAHVIAGFRAGGLMVISGMSWRLPRDVLKNYISTVSTGFFSIVPQYAPYAVLAASASSIALFNYAFKLVMLPAMVLATIIQMVLLQWFVKLHKESSLKNTTPLVMQLGCVISLAMTLCISLASPYIAMICFAYGEMSVGDVQAVADLLSVGIWALPSMVVGYVWQQFYFAQKITRPPLIMAIVQAVLMVPALWIGQSLSGVTGVMAAFIVIQSIPPLLYGTMAARQQLAKQFTLGLAGIYMIVAMLAAYLPLAWLYQHIPFTPVLGLLVAVGMGVVLLLAAIAPNAHCRRWLTTHVKNV
jgi:putative peptidoglycan lipid II flippase